jgi:hypothetical protein
MNVLPNRKLVLILSILSASIFNSKAQNILTHKKEEVPQEHSMWIQYSPLTLIEPEVPITATFLYKTSNRLAVALDAGFFIATQNYSDEGPKAYSGIRLKPELKYYLQSHKKEPLGMYVSLQGLIKRTIEKKEEWLSQQNSGGQFVFSQLANYRERKLVYGISFILGGEILLDKKQRWMLDLYWGIGFRNKQFKALDLPVGLSVDYDNVKPKQLFNLFLNGTYLSLPVGIKVGYRIK